MDTKEAEKDVKGTGIDTRIPRHRDDPRTKDVQEDLKMLVLESAVKSQKGHPNIVPFVFFVWRDCEHFCRLHVYGGLHAISVMDRITDSDHFFGHRRTVES